jgi:hypothetical protein
LKKNFVTPGPGDYKINTHIAAVPNYSIPERPHKYV